MELDRPARSRAAQRYVFFAERQAAKIADVPDDTPTLPDQEGRRHRRRHDGRRHRDELPQRRHSGDDRRDRSRTRSTAALGIIRKNYENTAKQGRLTQDEVEKRMGLLNGTLDLDALADCDLVIEAVFENMDIKKEVFGKLDKIAKPGAILATNTSLSRTSTRSPSATKRPEDVIGMHFFSPANVMRLLEVVRGDQDRRSR